ncbi:MAG: 30S ribosomal protein S6 [Anaerolineae bacterium]|nr:30S ribosomal protein S6 [Anaerolineae bacterium]
MRTYELTFVVRSDIAEDAVSNTIANVQQWVTAEEGNEVLRVDQWGRRKLAYPINDQREGHYILLEVTLSSESIAELERSLKLSDEILRYLLIRADE